MAAPNLAGVAYYVQDEIFGVDGFAMVRIAPPKQPATSLMNDFPSTFYLHDDDGVPLEAFSIPQASVGPLIARVVPLGATVHSVRFVNHPVKTFKSWTIHITQMQDLNQGFGKSPIDSCATVLKMLRILHCDKKYLIFLSLLSCQ